MQHIFPWSAVLSQHIGATADNIQKSHRAMWLQTAAPRYPIKWSQYRKSFCPGEISRADFTFLLTTQSVDFAFYILFNHGSSKGINGRTWYDMLQNRHHSNDFVLFISERLRLQQPQKMIATLRPRYGKNPKNTL
ncbi:MAG: hypothetical protein R3A45_02660 [Bdellovibrionota bacterium]